MSIRRHFPASVIDARERGVTLLGGARARDVEGSGAGDPQPHLVALFEAKRLDDIGGQANAEAVAPSLDPPRTVPCSGAALDIEGPDALAKRDGSLFVLD